VKTEEAAQQQRDLHERLATLRAEVEAGDRQ